MIKWLAHLLTQSAFQPPKQPGISIRKKAAAFLQLLDFEVGAEGVEPPTLCL